MCMCEKKCEKKRGGLELSCGGGNTLGYLFAVSSTPDPQDPGEPLALV